MRLYFTTFLCLSFLCASQVFAQSQCQSGRYAEAVFDCVDTTENIVYGQGRLNWSTTNIFCQHGALPPYNNFQDLLCDVYEPCNDSETARPLLIVIHGGAWAGGNKRDMAAYCHKMALRGYVVASISYRLSITPNILCWNAELDEKKLIRAFYRAMQDAKAAVRYFRAHAADWNIDSDNIFAAGHSAGAFNTLGLAYLTDDSERPEATFQQNYCGNWFNEILCTDLGGIEGEGGNAGFSSLVKAVIPIAGALPVLDFLDGPNDPPMLLVHGTADDVVPYGGGCVLPAIRALGLFNPCVYTYGSAAIYPYADSIGMEAELLTFQGGAHDFTQVQWDSIVSRSTRFLCCQLHDGNCQAVATETVFEKSPFEVFPNPTNGEIKIETSHATNFTAQLYDMNGRLLLQQNFATNRANLSLPNQPEGLYLLRLQTKGETFATRIVKL